MNAIVLLLKILLGCLVQGSVSELQQSFAAAELP